MIDARAAAPTHEHRGLWVLVAVALTAAALAGGFVFMHGLPWSSAAGEGEVTVAHSALRPGQIVLTLKSSSDEVVAIAQAIVNDAYVNFQAGTPGPGDLAIDYPWIEGESYEIELLTSTGSSVDFEIEDASAS
jgi:zinc transporter, ZIP family